MKTLRRTVFSFLFIGILVAGALYGQRLYSAGQDEQATYAPASCTESYIEILRPDIDPNIRAIIAESIDRWCLEYDLPQEIVVSLIARESSFLPWAKSRKDCLGLMQINPKAHPEKVRGYSAAELYHIDINVKIGCLILQQYLRASNSLGDALGRYVGSQGMKEYKRDIMSMAAELYSYRQ